MNSPQAQYESECAPDPAYDAWLDSFADQHAEGEYWEAYYEELQLTKGL